MEVIYVLMGLAIGLGISYSRIKEVKNDSNVRILENNQHLIDRIEEYKEAFSKGFQTKNGYQPYQKEDVESIVHDPQEVEEEQELSYEKPERWDD